MRAMAAVAAILIGSGDARAQPIYVFGGSAQIWRATGRQQQSLDDRAPERQPTPSILVGGGWWLTPSIALEGSVEFQRRQTLSWHYGYFANRDISSTDRDTPVLGHLRAIVVRTPRVSIETLAGGGVTWHSTKSFVVVECTTSFTTTCSTLSPPGTFGTYGTLEWTASGGVDVPIRVSRHMAVVPTARILYAKRREYLTSDNFRGPDSGPGLMPSIGLTLRWAVSPPDRPSATHRRSSTER